MKLSHRHCLDLIPWWVNGRIEEPDRLAVEEHLRHCADCRADADEQQRLRHFMSADPVVDYAPGASLQRLMTKINAEDGPSASSPRLAGKRIAAAFKSRPTQLTQWLAAAVLVEAIGLAIVGGALWRASPPERSAEEFRTLSTGSAPTGSLRVAGSLRVVFAPTMTLGELNSLLQDLHLTVLSGPSPAGVYTLAVEPNGESLANELAALRARSEVRFAELIDAPTETPRP